MKRQRRHRCGSDPLCPVDVSVLAPIHYFNRSTIFDMSFGNAQEAFPDNRSGNNADTGTTRGMPRRNPEHGKHAVGLFARVICSVVGKSVSTSQDRQSLTSKNLKPRSRRLLSDSQPWRASGIKHVEAQGKNGRKARWDCKHRTGLAVWTRWDEGLFTSAHDALALRSGTGD